MSSDRDINLAILGEDLTKKATDSAGRNFDGLQKKVDGFSAKKPSKQIEDFSRLVTSQLNDGESAFDGINRVIGETELKAESLRKSFAGTGSAGVFGDLKSVEDDLKSLEGILAEMGGTTAPAAAKSGKKAAAAYGDEFIANLPLGIGKGALLIGKLLTPSVDEAAKIGGQAGGAFADGLASSADAAAQDIPSLFTPEGAIGAGIIAVIGGSLAAVAGGALATALTAGVGFGFIGIAALVEKENQYVVANFMQLKTDIGSELADAASPLVDSFDRALRDADKTVAAQKPQFEQLFTSVAPAVDEISNGIDKFIEDLTPKLVDIGKLFSAMLADPDTKAELHTLESSIITLFSNVTENKQAVIDFFHAFLVVTAAGVEGVGYLEDAWVGFTEVLRYSPIGLASSGITKIIDFLDRDSAAAGQAADSHNDLKLSAGAAAAALGELSVGASKAVPVWDALGATLSATTVTIDSVASQATDKILGTLLSLDHATLGWEESLTTLGPTLKQHKANLDITSAAGQADREAILGVVGANQAQYDSMIKAGFSARDAAKAYDSNFDALEHLHGLTKDQQAAVDGLIGKYKGVPDKVNTEIGLSDLDKILNDIDDVLRKLAGIPARVPVDVDIAAHVNSSLLDKAVNTISHAARAALSSGNHWMPADVAANGVGGGSQQPPREVAVTSNITSSLVLDGQVIDRRVYRVQSQQRHAQRVGKR